MWKNVWRPLDEVPEDLDVYRRPSHCGIKSLAYTKVQKAVSAFEEQINNEVRERVLDYLEQEYS
jgi:hypothetical protein